nr:PTPA-CTERM sorting domain-containing protein [Nodosilinea sp. FACHB-131]
MFDEVRLFSSEAAFEVDNIAYRTEFPSTTPVPTPALLPGLIGMGIAAYRKRKPQSLAQPETANL